MRKHARTRTWIAALAALPIFPGLMFAQAPAQQSGAASSSASAPFDPHDLSGMWEFFIGVPGQGIYATPSKTPPPMTAWAKARYEAAKPGYGPKAQAGGNDPILKCSPSGVPRILFFPEPFEMVRTPDRLFMFFEREHAWRQIWTDGRSHPQDPDPSWMGDSIGRWDGDTFVVDTVGFNDESWLDFYGDPHSEDMHVMERYKRVDHDTLTLQLVIEDPKAYTATWTGDTKIFKLLKGKKAYMDQLFCVPEEEEAFKERIRTPAATPKPAQ